MIPDGCPKCSASRCHIIASPTRDALGRVARWWHCIKCGYGDDLEEPAIEVNKKEPEQLSLLDYLGYNCPDPSSP